MVEGEKYIIAIDQGTTSSRALLVNKDLKIVTKAQRDLPNYTPHPGWVEQNPEEIYSTVVECLQDLVRDHNLSKANVVSIGITNQRETTTAFDFASGEFLHNSLVWLDTRTKEVVHEILAKNGNDVDKYRGICGLPLNTFFFMVKMMWLLKHSDKVRAAKDTGTLKFCTVDSWLVL